MTKKSSFKYDKMEHEKPEIIRITPKAEDLQANRILKCSEEDCTDTFKNLSNLQMHLARHHKIKTSLGNGISGKSAIYFCPENDCVYHENTKGGKFFTSLKYVRQHFQKVHAEKKFNCEKCLKVFLTDGALKAHVNNCGRVYKCTCGWEYSSREALLTHAKRKGHILQDGELQKLPTVDSKEKIKLLPHETNFNPIQILVKVCSELKDMGTQTDSFVQPKKAAPTKRKSNQHADASTKRSKEYLVEPLQPSFPEKTEKSTHLDFELFVNPSEEGKQKVRGDLNNLSYPEDATEEKPKENGNLNNLSYSEDTVNSCFDQLVNSSTFCHIETQTEFSSAILDQMLYSNTHTQTCDEFLSELGLSDIQTQTNWSGRMDSGGGGGSGSGAHDELLVSTETQTSFTQCLLDYNGASASGITQHTQTCDTLLEGLFGGQESDFIANFQSTHTQT